MGNAALFGIAGLSVWLLAAGAFMTFYPAQALIILSLTASTRTINNLEQGLRLLAGIALLIRSPLSKMPHLFEVGGWFIIVSSIVLLLLPLKWHAAYAIWWADRLKPWMVRLIGTLSAVAGIALIYTAN